MKLIKLLGELKVLTFFSCPELSLAQSMLSAEPFELLSTGTIDDDSDDNDDKDDNDDNDDNNDDKTK